MADDEDGDGGAAATMKKGGELFKMFFRECFWRPVEKDEVIMSRVEAEGK